VPDDIKITLEPQGVGFRWDGGMTDQQKRLMAKSLHERGELE